MINFSFITYVCMILIHTSKSILLFHNYYRVMVERIECKYCKLSLKGEGHYRRHLRTLHGIKVGMNKKQKK